MSRIKEDIFMLLSLNLFKALPQTARMSYFTQVWRRPHLFSKIPKRSILIFSLPQSLPFLTLLAGISFIPFRKFSFNSKQSQKIGCPSTKRRSHSKHRWHPTMSPSSIKSFHAPRNKWHLETLITNAAHIDSYRLLWEMINSHLCIITLSCTIWLVSHRPPGKD